MPQSIVTILLIFAAVGFAGAGVSFAVARVREIEDAETDLGMRTVSALLFFFGAACIFVASGFSGIFAYGGVISWSSYILAAQRLGVFQLEDRYITDHDPRSADFVQRHPRR